MYELEPFFFFFFLLVHKKSIKLHDCTCDEMEAQCWVGSIDICRGVSISEGSLFGDAWTNRTQVFIVALNIRDSVT